MPCRQECSEHTADFNETYVFGSNGIHNRLISLTMMLLSGRTQCKLRPDCRFKDSLKAERFAGDSTKEWDVTQPTQMAKQNKKTAGS